VTRSGRDRASSHEESFRGAPSASNPGRSPYLRRGEKHRVANVADVLETEAAGVEDEGRLLSFRSENEPRRQR
jgi:hypothetical protein